MKKKLPNYDTDEITNIICQYYNHIGIFEEDKAIIELARHGAIALAEYIIDSFNSNSLNIDNIKKIPKKE